MSNIKHSNRYDTDEVECIDNNVEHPNHYNTGDIECIDAMISAYGYQAVENFCILNAFKYLWRFEHKNGIEDLDKMNWYINKYKELTAPAPKPTTIDEL